MGLRQFKTFDKETGETKSYTDATYSTWANMRQRCDNPNRPDYLNYGGRGITYQHSWKEFKNFLADMGEKPNSLSLDRIDNFGDYTKENCRWATRKEQNRNTRCTALTEAVVCIIKAAQKATSLSNHALSIELSIKLNLKRSTIAGVLNGRTWK